MKNGNIFPEVGGEDMQELGRQGDLGHQHHSRFATVQRRTDEADIDLGLTTPGDAV